MDYIGPQDYFFWIGIECGYYRVSNNPLPENNNTNITCNIAFEDGYSIGEELTHEEYMELTTPPKNVILKAEEIITKAKVNIFDENIKGNC